MFYFFVHQFLDLDYLVSDKPQTWVFPEHQGLLPSLLSPAPSQHPPFHQI